MIRYEYDIMRLSDHSQGLSLRTLNRRGADGWHVIAHLGGNRILLERVVVTPDTSRPIPIEAAAPVLSQ